MDNGKMRKYFESNVEMLTEDLEKYEKDLATAKKDLIDDLIREEDHTDNYWFLQAMHRGMVNVEELSTKVATTKQELYRVNRLFTAFNNLAKGE